MPKSTATLLTKSTRLGIRDRGDLANQVSARPGTLRQIFSFVATWVTLFAVTTLALSVYPPSSQALLMAIEMPVGFVGSALLSALITGLFEE